jgi:hypothetical protein
MWGVCFQGAATRVAVLYGVVLAAGCGGNVVGESRAGSGSGGVAGATTGTDSGAGGSCTCTGTKAVPQARAAVAVIETGRCIHTGFPVPNDPPHSTGTVLATVSCSLQEPACQPDDYTVAQGDPGVTVACTVSPTGDSFDVDVDVDVHTNALSFHATGTVILGGGMLDVSQANGGQLLRDRGCHVSIGPNHGVAKKGVIWADFQCDALVDPDDSNAAPCSEQGAFIFENCDSL